MRRRLRQFGIIATTAALSLPVLNVGTAHAATADPVTSGWWWSTQTATNDLPTVGVARSEIAIGHNNITTLSDPTGNTMDKVAAVQFDMTGITSVTTASVTLTEVRSTLIPDVEHLALSACAIVTDWEASFGGTGSPGCSPTGTFINAMRAPDGRWAFDISDFAQEWANGAPNHGIFIFGPPNALYNYQITFSRPDASDIVVNDLTLGEAKQKAAVDLSIIGTDEGRIRDRLSAEGVEVPEGPSIPGEEEPPAEDPGSEDPGSDDPTAVLPLPGEEEPPAEDPGSEDPGDIDLGPFGTLPGSLLGGDEEPGDEEPPAEDPGSEDPGDIDLGPVGTLPGSLLGGDEEPGDEEPPAEEPPAEDPGTDPGVEDPGTDPGVELPDVNEFLGSSADPGTEDPAEEDPAEEEAPSEEAPSEEAPAENPAPEVPAVPSAPSTEIGVGVSPSTGPLGIRITPRVKGAIIEGEQLPVVDTASYDYDFSGFADAVKPIDKGVELAAPALPTDTDGSGGSSAPVAGIAATLSAAGAGLVELLRRRGLLFG